MYFCSTQVEKSNFSLTMSLIVQLFFFLTCILFFYLARFDYFFFSTFSRRILPSLPSQHSREKKMEKTYIFFGRSSTSERDTPCEKYFAFRTSILCVPYMLNFYYMPIRHICNVEFNFFVFNLSPKPFIVFSLHFTDICEDICM